MGLAAQSSGLRQTVRLASIWLLLASIALSPVNAAETEAAARGAYLAAAAGCDQCHTDAKNGGRPYAGGRALNTSSGVLFSPNITPDEATGIGRWNVTAFTRALRWGIAPDDSHYLPSFPFPFYNRLSDRDVLDLKAFLETLPAVTQVNRAAGGSVLSVTRARAAISVIAQPFPGPWTPDPSKDQNWNRGAYLVAAVGRCADCHTPRNIFGAPDRERAFSGTSAGPGGKMVPNITSDTETGIGSWSEEEIETLLKLGQTPEFDFVGGAMAEIVHNTSRLDDADRSAIAIFLKSLPAIHSQKKGR